MNEPITPAQNAHGPSVWCIADNLRKGALLNAVQAVEELVRAHMRKAA